MQPPRFFRAFLLLLASLLLLAGAGCVGSESFPENDSGVKLVIKDYQNGLHSRAEYIALRQNMDQRYDPETDPVLKQPLGVNQPAAGDKSSASSSSSGSSWWSNMLGNQSDTK